MSVPLVITEAALAAARSARAVSDGAVDRRYWAHQLLTCLGDLPSATSSQRELVAALAEEFYAAADEIDHGAGQEAPRPTGRSSPSLRRDGSHCPPRETARTAGLDLLPGTNVTEAERSHSPMDPRPVAATGCCTHCGGVTWHHQARDICGRCGRSIQTSSPGSPAAEEVSMTITTSPRTGSHW